MQREALARAGVSNGRPQGSTSYWLIVGRGGAHGALTLHSRLRGETLPVFGSEEDAGAFLADTFLRPMGAFGGGLTARRVAAQDLASLLSGRLSGVGTVALDPTPGADTAAVIDLVSTDRESFVESLTGGSTKDAGGPAQRPGWSASAWSSLLMLALLGLMLATPAEALAQDEGSTEVGTEGELRAAWADPLETSIRLTEDIYLRQCRTGDPIRESARPMQLDGGGHTIRQTCFEKRVLRQDGTGYLLIKDLPLTLVRSDADGNTTDGDGGALYADEDGDVTVVDSSVDGNDADGPGGAIWTLDGDVTAVGSTLNGNRADDRGGAIGGEADVVVINSTIARNAAVAHVGGGIFSRGNLYVANSTVSNNYAEGQGGGILGGGVVRLDHATILDNVSSVANIGAGERLESFASIIGPARTEGVSGEVQPSERNCRVSDTASFGHNFVFDASCGLGEATDAVGQGLPMLGPLLDNGGFGETRLPEVGSPVLERMTDADCKLSHFDGVLQVGDQHLEGLVEPRSVLMLKDQR